MKTKQLFYAILFFIGLSATAQQAPFMVCNSLGTTCAPYTTLDLAYAGASSGDYIYLPAGEFTLTPQINKVVNFIGAGFDTNASAATGITRISGNLVLTPAANNSTFEGFYLTGNFLNSATVSNISFSYLNFNRTDPQSPGNNSVWNNCLIKNSVVREYLYFGNNGVYGANNIVMNSIVNSIHSTILSTIKNCIVSTYSSTGHCFVGIQSSTIKNCIIGGQGLNGNSVVNSNVNFINNATTAPAGQLVFSNAGCVETNNTYGITAANTFATATLFTYNQAFNYDVKTTSPANNGGDDMKDMGIYGGNIPWKVGAIPSNPHIAAKNISGTTDSSGNLPVQITVTTQN
jgi:hypothetical protein